MFVDGPLVAGQSRLVEGNGAHYLAQVMRMTIGSAVLLCDDETGEWLAEIVAVGKRRVDLLVKEHCRPREAVPDLWLCAALIKKAHFDFTLEKATELGVAVIQPLLTRRCVADKLNPERARVITVEAAEQCGRTALPLLQTPAKLDHLLRDWPQDRWLFFADEAGGAPLAQACGAQPGAAAILIGPEGGFDDAERAAIRAHPKAVAISLGPRILRAETAAIAACAVWLAVNG